MAPKRRPKTVGEVLYRIQRRKSPPPCTKGFADHFQTFVTEGVVQRIHQLDAWRAMRKFLACDWGDVDRSTAIANNRHTSISARGGKPTLGDRVYGVYHDRRKREFWIIADPRARRLVLLLPSEV